MGALSVWIKDVFCNALQNEPIPQKFVKVVDKSMWHNNTSNTPTNLTTKILAPKIP